MTKLNLRSDKVVSQVQVNTKVGEPPHQSRCKSTLLLEKQWRMTEFGKTKKGEDHKGRVK